MCVCMLLYVQSIYQLYIWSICLHKLNVLASKTPINDKAKKTNLAGSHSIVFPWKKTNTIGPINTQNNSPGISIALNHYWNWVQAFPCTFSTMDSWCIRRNAVPSWKLHLYLFLRCLNFLKLHAEEKCYSHSDQSTNLLVQITIKVSDKKK